MSAQSASPAPRPIRQAATLVVLRDGSQGLEALLLRRADKAHDQNSGATVFPGGVLDAHDRRLHALGAGIDDAQASARLGMAEGGLDYYAAAVRECFEEAGLLFACDAQGSLVELDGLVAAQLQDMRRAAAAGADALPALCEARGWRLALDRLDYFSHWLTPPGMPRRFDTRFFMAPMPAGQSVQVDGLEIVDHAWLRPADALDPARGLKLMNVTRRILEQLAAFASVEDALTHARALREIGLTMPRLAGGPGGQRAVNMEEAAYAEIGYLDPDGRGHARHTLQPGLVLQLGERVWRVTAGDAASPDAPGEHSYFVGGSEGGWALIDAMPHDAAHCKVLGEAAPGPVRWVLSTRGPGDARLRQAWPEAAVPELAPGDRLTFGDGASLQVLGVPGDPQARCFLLLPEGMLFTGAVDVETLAGLPSTVAWLASSRGFIRPHLTRSSTPPSAPR